MDKTLFISHQSYREIESLSSLVQRKHDRYDRLTEKKSMNSFDEFTEIIKHIAREKIRQRNSLQDQADIERLANEEG